MDKAKRFVLGFFESLGSRVSWEDNVLVVENVQGKFEEAFGKKAPYRFIFDKSGSQEEMFAGKGSVVMDCILRFLKKGGKMSILRIDFADVDSEKILSRLNLKNCEVESVGRKFRNNFFTRFSFVVNFNYLNESERVVEEVFVYDGSVIEGSLDGYSVVDGDKLEVDKERVKADYEVALRGLGERLAEVRERISGELKEKMDVEVRRIEDYYDVQLREFGGDLAGRLERIRELELEIRGAEEEDKERLLVRLERLRKGLVKDGADDSVERVKRERVATIEDAKQKFSLGVSRKLVNTTVVYYPVFVFKVYLREGSSKRLVEICYDPLTGEMDGLRCESCGKVLDRINLCENGHLICDDCMGVCGECGGKFCLRCLERGCSSCGRKLCKNCLRVCRGCGKYTCLTHMRRDCVSGEERCVMCLRACMRCHGMSEERFFGEARDGSKVCEKCLGAERRKSVLDEVFEK
jgi:hypothetical protein